MEDTPSPLKHRSTPGMKLGVSAPRGMPLDAVIVAQIAKFKDDYAPAWLPSVATAGLSRRV
jgi:hypothetical protein